MSRFDRCSGDIRADIELDRVINTCLKVRNEIELWIMMGRYFVVGFFVTINYTLQLTNTPYKNHSASKERNHRWSIANFQIQIPTIKRENKTGLLHYFVYAKFARCPNSLYTNDFARLWRFATRCSTNHVVKFPWFIVTVVKLRKYSVEHSKLTVRCADNYVHRNTKLAVGRPWFQYTIRNRHRRCKTFPRTDLQVVKGRLKVVYCRIKT